MFNFHYYFLLTTSPILSLSLQLSDSPELFINQYTSANTSADNHYLTLTNITAAFLQRAHQVRLLRVQSGVVLRVLRSNTETTKRPLSLPSKLGVQRSIIQLRTICRDQAALLTTCKLLLEIHVLTAVVQGPSL